MKPLLSIVIPTLNSGNVLSPNLSVLIPQVKAHPSVELIIINNGSTDNTQEVIDSYNIDDISNAKCVIRKETIDAMKNFDDGVSRAEGEYVLLLGDDDILSPAFLDTVLPYLDNKIGVFHYNKIIGGNNFTNNVLPNPERYSGVTTIYYDCFQDFLFEYTYEFNFMSSIIFKNEVWIKGKQRVPFQNLQGYQWYANIVYGAIEFSAIYFYFPLVVQRVRDRSWFTSWPLYWIAEMFSIFKDIDNIFPGIYKRWYTMQHDNELRHFYAVLGLISQDKSFYREKKEIFSCILTESEMWLYDILLDYPTSISNIIRKFYSFCKTIKHRL